MNGMKPKFITEEVNPDYYKIPDPYVNPPSCNVNLLAMSRYTKEHGKKMAELTKEEVEQFIINE